MTPDQARQLLDDVRAGHSAAPQHRINLALQMTGDLHGPWADAKVRAEHDRLSADPRFAAWIAGSAA